MGFIGGDFVVDPDALRYMNVNSPPPRMPSWFHNGKLARIDYIHNFCCRSQPFYHRRSLDFVSGGTPDHLRASRRLCKGVFCAAAPDDNEVLNFKTLQAITYLIVLENFYINFLPKKLCNQVHLNIVNSEIRWVIHTRTY